MALRFFSFLLIGAFIGQLVFAPAPCWAASPQEQKQTIKEKVFEINPGTVVVVKTRDKEQIRGRFQAMTDEGFTLQVAKGDKITERTLSFTDVKSFKAEGAHHASSTVGHVILGGLAALGVLVVIVGIAAASGGLSN